MPACSLAIVVMLGLTSRPGQAGGETILFVVVVLLSMAGKLLIGHG